MSSYPDRVIRTKCMNCEGVFYIRFHADACPYCEANNDDELTVVNKGSGVVCHHAGRNQNSE